MPIGSTSGVPTPPAPNALMPFAFMGVYPDPSAFTAIQNGQGGAVEDAKAFAEALKGSLPQGARLAYGPNTVTVIDTKNKDMTLGSFSIEGGIARFSGTRQAGFMNSTTATLRAAADKVDLPALLEASRAQRGPDSFGGGIDKLAFSSRHGQSFDTDSELEGVAYRIGGSLPNNVHMEIGPEGLNFVQNGQTTPFLTATNGPAGLSLTRGPSASPQAAALETQVRGQLKELVAANPVAPTAEGISAEALAGIRSRLPAGIEANVVGNRVNFEDTSKPAGDPARVVADIFSFGGHFGDAEFHQPNHPALRALLDLTKGLEQGVPPAPPAAAPAAGGAIDVHNTVRALNQPGKLPMGVEARIDPDNLAVGFFSGASNQPFMVAQPEGGKWTVGAPDAAYANMASVLTTALAEGGIQAGATVNTIDRPLTEIRANARPAAGDIPPPPPMGD